MGYTKLTDYAVKDGLPSGNSSKIIRGVEIDADLSAIQVDLALKATANNPTFTGTATFPSGTTLDSPIFTGNPTAPTASVGDSDTTVATTAFVQTALALYPGTNLGLPSFTIVDALKSLRINGTGNGYQWIDEKSATEVLTNKDLTSGTNTFPTSLVTLTGTQSLTNKTLTGYTETVYALAGTDINPANGTVQTKTLSGNTTFTESIADGQSVVLMLNPSTFTTTWPTTSWVTAAGSGSAPTLKASVVNTIVLWQVGGVLYGNWIGSM